MPGSSSTTRIFTEGAGGGLEKFDGQREVVAFAIAGLDRSQDHEDKPGDGGHREQDHADAEKKAQDGKQKVNGPGDLKIKNILADLIQRGNLGFFHQPEDQRGQDVTGRKDQAGEGAQVGDDGPLIAR